MEEIIHLNQFNSRKDNKVKTHPISWDVLVDFVLSDPDTSTEKGTVPLFNCAQYKSKDDSKSDIVQDLYTFELFTRRRQVNILNVDVLILDYDGGISIDEAKKRFLDYEYVGYTSFNHRFGHDSDKFRLLIRLSKPIPSNIEVDEYGYKISSGIWDELGQSLLEFAGDCDPSSINQNQIYHVPSVHPDNLDNYSSWHNSGKSLDWESLQSCPVDNKNLRQSTDGNPLSDINRNNKHLHPNDILLTEIGSVRVGDIKSKIEGVTCPFHDDKNGSEFVKHVPETGNTFLYCKNCNSAFFMDSNYKDVIDDDLEDIPLLEFETDKLFVDGSDRTSAIQQLKEIEKQIITDIHSKTPNKNTKYKSHIIYSPEGSGKSHLVVSLAKRGEKIIFTCKSWKQVEQKYEEFTHLGDQLGFSTEIIRSKDAKAQRRFGTKIVKTKSKSPYLPGQEIDEESIEGFIKANSDLNPDSIKVIWKYFNADKLSFELIPSPEFDESGNEIDANYKILDKNVNIIFTSFEQLRIQYKQKVNIPKEWIIWFDDPDINDVIDIELYKKESWGELSESDIQKLTIDVNNRTYFTREIEKSLGYTVQEHKCVYTTTEMVTKEAVERLFNKRNEQYIVHDSMENIAGGKITILGTNKVWKRNDGIIPLLSRRLNKSGFPLTLIADGLCAKFNHSNNKGRNDLSNVDLLIELSIPYPDQIRTLCDAFDIDYKLDGRKIRDSIMLDRLHQAIGRNSGYRYQGFQSVVLVDKSVHASLIQDTRYYIDYENSVIIDKTNTMSRKDSRITTSATPLVTHIVELLNNIDSYVSDKRKIKYDLDYVVKTIENDSDRIKLIIRILISFSSNSGVIFGENSSSTADNYIQVKYREIGDWLIDNWVPDNKRDYVIEESKKY